MAAVMKRLLVSLLLTVGWVALAWGAGEQPIIIPQVTDPSPVVDGDLQEWADRGALREVNAPGQVTYGKGDWQGIEDLSGWVRFGYDKRNLYVSCHVVDSVFSQKHTGTDIWQGDHVMGFLDFARTGKQTDMILFGLSPGNSESPGGVINIKPEFVIFEPKGRRVTGAVVASVRTTEGYDIEAAIPWELFDISPGKYQTFTVEIAFSDSDQPTPHQESCMTITTRPWSVKDPKRLIPAGLADRAGAFPDDAFHEAVLLGQDVVIPKGEVKAFTLSVNRIPEGQIPTLTFKARVDRDRAGGCAGVLLTKVNGKVLQKGNIANRPANMQFMSGDFQPSWYKTGIVLYYSPDFEEVERTPYKPVDCKACEFTLRLDKLIQVGKNTISFQNTISHADLNVVMADVQFSWSSPSRFKPAKVYKPAPQGALLVREPWKEHKVDYKIEALPGGALKLSWHNQEVIIRTGFSKPDGVKAAWLPDKPEGWERSDTALQRKTGMGGAGTMAIRSKTGPLEVTRMFFKEAEWTLVRDILINKSQKLLPVIITHTAGPVPCKELRLGGRPIPNKSGSKRAPENPSVVVLGEESGVGLIARDDVFRVHSRVGFDGSAASLADNSLVLRPNIRYEHEWLVVPLPKPDYWHFVNAMRRHFRTNFTIPGSFCFFSLHREDVPLMPWDVEDYLDRKSVRYVTVRLMAWYKGLFPHGPVKRRADIRRVLALNKVVRALRPKLELLSYFNCFDCARAKGDTVLWPECRILRPDGQQAYNGPSYPLYFPTLDNAYGKEMDENIRWILNTVGADGLYWDCYSHSGAATHYGEPWDGWSADIHPAKHTIVRKKSSVALISWPWREKATAALLSRWQPLVANHSPVTTSEMKYHFPRFVETADISALSKAHLYTPIALGDHVTERNEVDCYRWMLDALDWGGLYYWYSAPIVPTRPTLTAYMFPFTPIELHSGYLIGQERILTNRSGLFGWGDLSQFEVHAFDRVGKETDTIQVPRIIRDRKAYAEVRIPGGYSVAIVRKR